VNNFIILNVRAIAVLEEANMEFEQPLESARALSAAAARRAEGKDAGARDGRLQRVRRDWRILAGEWLALAGAIEQFEREFEGLEENLNRRWERGGECFRWKTLGAGPIA
jgi:hypothetical protein